MIWRVLAVLLALLPAAGGGALADPVEDGIAAARRGDHAAAWRLLRPLAEAGDAKAQNVVGYMYDHGLGTAQNPTEAMKWFSKAAEQGLSAAQFNLCLYYRRAQNDGPALGWCRKAAEQGEVEAQHRVGLFYELGIGAPKDLLEAVRWYRRAANQGLAASQNSLGNCYEFGSGVGRDVAEAARWYRRAADHGDALAEANLGRLYRTGRGVFHDAAEGARWLKLAAEKGNAVAQNALAFAYQRGDGVPQDMVEAIKWFTKSAEQDNADAQLSLGFLLSNGTVDDAPPLAGVAWYLAKAGLEGRLAARRDYSLARRWYGAAAELGVSFAMVGLAGLFELGQGGPADPVAAYRWYSRAIATLPVGAADHRHFAEAHRAALEASMTQEQRAAAKAVAK